MRHITHIEADPESLRRGGSCRTAACTCGWRGPQRGTMVLAADDALSHEGVADHKPPAGASPLEVVTGPARRRGAGDAYQGNDAPLTAAEGELLRRASHPAMKFACAAAHGTSRDDPRRRRYPSTRRRNAASYSSGRGGGGAGVGGGAGDGSSSGPS